jgi:hypothetical protein
MSKKKEPQMAHPQPAQEALISEFESLIDGAADQVDENELAKREKEANEVVENVRARVARRERA